MKVSWGIREYKYEVVLVQWVRGESAFFLIRKHIIIPFEPTGTALQNF